MPDRAKVLIFLAILVGLITLPFWYNRGQAVPAPHVSAEELGAQPIEPVEYMRAHHMDLLEAWREQAVRHGDYDWVASDGTTYEISFEETCLACHAPATDSESSQDFCLECHSYSGGASQIDCFTCHVPEKGGSR